MNEPLTIVMISMHTSPLAQPGQGDAGGLNVYVRNLSEALIRAGHQVLAFTRKTAATEEVMTIDGATDSQVVPVASGRLKLPKEALSELTTQFAETMATEVLQRAKHPVILHSHYWLSGVAALHATQRLRSPVVHTMHTLGAAKNSSEPGSEPPYRIERETYISLNASALTANTAVEKRELVHHTGVDPARVVVVHPGVDHSVFSFEGPAEWPGRQIGDSLKVLFAGRLQPFKGPHVLIEALVELRKRGHQPLPTIHFTGAASGQHDYDLHAKAYLLGVAQQCSFSGPVAPAVLARYMRAADIVAVPSVAESFGLVAIEAQACGTPVMAHRAGGLSIAVADGKSGQLMDSLRPQAWADALESALTQPQLWRGYGQAGVQHAKKFSWTSMAQRMTKLYRNVLQGI